MKRNRLLEDYRADKEKALSDLQRLQEQMIGVKYVIMYLNQKIQEQTGGKNV